MAVSKKVERKEEKVQQDGEDMDIRFDTVVQVWINSSTLERFKGHTVIPQRAFQGVSKFTGAPYIGLEVYDKDEDIYANIKLSKTVMRSLVEKGIYSVKDMLGFEFKVGSVAIKIMGKDVELPILVPTEETLKKLKEIREKEKGDGK